MRRDTPGFFDLHSPGLPQRDAADWIVIGSGAAGGVAAQTLAEAGHEVIIVEEGPLVEHHELRRDIFSAFSNVWRDAGFQVAQGRSMLPIIQGCAVGGSTLINAAIIHRIPEQIHDHWVRDFGAGELLKMDTLQTAYDAMDADLSVAVTPRSALGGNNEAMQRGCQALGIQSNVIRRNVKGCDGSAGCLQGCVNSRKQSSDVALIPRAMARGARLYATCRAERFEHKAGRVSGVQAHFRDPRDGSRGPDIHLEARKGVVVAASAIQTPILLQKNGIGKSSRLVGRRFQCHPGAGLVAVFKDPVKIWSGGTQAYETLEWWDERMKIESLAFPPEIGFPRLPGYGAELMGLRREYPHLASAGVQIRARGQGRVKRGLFGQTVIHWDFTPEDMQTLKLGLYRLAEIYFAAGATHVYPGVYGMPDAVRSMDEMRPILEIKDDPRRFHGIASHLFGTAVMGTDPAHSVVDPFLQCHDAPGLHVVDSSVFPTNMGVNPAHTISTVARVAANHLAHS